MALTVAGSDPSGGAGIQADLKTFTALGVYGASVITALTAQNTRGVTGILKVDPDFIRAQFDAVTGDLAIGAVKTGMLADAATVTTVAGLIRGWAKGPVVVDPVMVATSGDVLLEADAIEAVRTTLLPLATLITPNLPEAATLLGRRAADSEPDLIAQGRALLAFGCKAVLIKGGHARSAEAVDYLVTATDVERLSRPRIATRNTHGTGCTLSAAIAAGLAKGDSLTAAAHAAKDFVTNALISGAAWKVGEGNGPVDHLHGVRPCRAKS
jgi:hydroxymethylpyrimidine/phosphomethylpyrimidine kinase